MRWLSRGHLHTMQQEGIELLIGQPCSSRHRFEARGLFSQAIIRC